MDISTTRETWEQDPGLLESMWRHRLLIMLVTLVAGAAGYGLALTQPTRYEASAELLLALPGTSDVFGETGRSVDPVRYVAKQTEVITSTPVAERASELLDGRLSPRQVQDRVEVESDPELDLVLITASDADAADAAAIANAVANAYQQTNAEDAQASVEEAVAQLADAQAAAQERVESLEEALAANPDDAVASSRLDAAVQQLETLENQLSQLAVEGALRGSGVELFEPAAEPSVPAQPRPRPAGALAAVLGLGAASALAYWRAGRTQSADSADTPAPVLQAPCLGEIPVFKGAGGAPVVGVPGNPVVAEAYQFVLASLEIALSEMGGSAVLFTSAHAGDGKSITALNVALAAHRDGRPMLLVDADLRARGLTVRSGTPTQTGLVDLALKERTVDECLRGFPAGRSKMPFVPAGYALEDPAGFFRTSAFRKTMVRLKSFAELIVVDAPPLLGVSDTSAIAGQVDGIVVVVNRGTRLSHLEALRDRLDFIGTPLLGYVFNRGRAMSPYPYGYGNPAASANGRRRRAKRGAARTKAAR